MKDKSLLKNGRFCNSHAPVGGPKTFLDFLRWKVRSKSRGWPSQINRSVPPKIPSQIGADEVYITHINHSSLLIQLENLNILTDPVLSTRAGPYPWLGVKRVQPPGLSIAQLPKIDLVLVSHNHYDHMDLDTLRLLWEKDHPVFVIPLENRRYLKEAGIESVIELDWWEEYRINPSQAIILTPAQHWSRRGPFDYCKALWGSFLIQSHLLKIYFAGDTGYNTHFKQIKEEYGKMDVSLLPIGAYEPRWFMREAHMNPDDAVQAHLDLESTLSIGIHCETFQLTDEGFDEPRIELQNSLSSRGLKTDEFLVPDNGQTILFTA
jgi:L-ascorbate metabolism protein UlaG (beta-lactamase superfamily)